MKRKPSVRSAQKGAGNLRGSLVARIVQSHYGSVGGTKLKENWKCTIPFTPLKIRKRMGIFKKLQRFQGFQLKA
jgi:hypothetical protein